MILFIEPISNNIGMYVPAYPLPLMEIAGFVKTHLPDTEIRILSIPVDYGLPLTKEGKEKIYGKLINDLTDMGPAAVGISCTAISQAEQTIELCRRIKQLDPGILTFIGGYFPTIYPEEIFSRTHAVDFIIEGEGEIASLEMIKAIRRGKDPKNEIVPNLVWQKNGQVHRTRKAARFDLRQKALLNPKFLRNPDAYDVLPYAFSRGCPYQCSFCMEDYIRPHRKEVPHAIVREDLKQMFRHRRRRTLLVADALFKSFHIISFLRSLGVTVNFETRCDVLDIKVIPELVDVCGVLALGLESASYHTLKRMNKVKSRSHYEQYMFNAEAIFREGARHGIPMMVFMIAGYPGDTVEDLQKSLDFAKKLSRYGGPGGHVFKIGECRVYPKTRLFEIASSMDDTLFDNDGVFGDNIVRQSSKNVTFETILHYMDKIFSLSNTTGKLRDILFDVMPFFRFPLSAITDDSVPAECFKGSGRSIFDTRMKSLAVFRRSAPALLKKFEANMSGERGSRKIIL